MAAPGGKSRKETESPLDRLIRESSAVQTPPAASSGSLYEPAGRFGDLARDLRAAQVHDLVTIVIYDKASALSKGTTSTSRKSEAKASIRALAGPLKTAGPLTSLADLGGEGKLDGQGATSRETELKTTLSARVTHVLPNGHLVVSGSKDVMINSERQRVTVRGILRWNDLSQTNRVSSDRLAELEVRVDGKGVVNDAIRRPGFLYRFLLGLLPF
ncbi:MAG: flagellar basal body L-ring protein FlgH [Acidobacteria bacterium]|nr:flagellar basal body L-ring protein FlgH [Acidobacteriota bacterium]